jgi:hypothetical protein
MEGKGFTNMDVSMSTSEGAVTTSASHQVRPQIGVDGSSTSLTLFQSLESSSPYGLDEELRGKIRISRKQLEFAADPAKGMAELDEAIKNQVEIALKRYRSYVTEVFFS